MEHEDDEDMKIWYAKQARYAACCASVKGCGWMKGKEDQYIFKQYQITYWADQKTWEELDMPKSPIISTVGGACPEECYGK